MHLHHAPLPCPTPHRYEQRPDKKHRAPAWCDRILWRCTTANPTEHVRQQAYGRTEEVGAVVCMRAALLHGVRCQRCCTRHSQKMSDHKPVHSLFTVSVKTVVETQRQSVRVCCMASGSTWPWLTPAPSPARLEQVLREIMRRLDKMENESIPKAKLSTTVVHFPGVVYKQRCRQAVVIKNTGEVGGGQGCGLRLLHRSHGTLWSWLWVCRWWHTGGLCRSWRRSM